MNAEGKTFNRSLYDMMHTPPEDTRTAEEIIADVIERGGLEVTDGRS